MSKKKVVFLVGPTAVGKTQVSVLLAKKLNAEIINCDSMQIYQKMDIVTSKPSLKTRKQIPHHLLDFVSPSRTYDAHRFSVDARREIREIIGKGKLPLFVGGSGLYMKAAIDGFFPEAKTDLRLRRELEELPAEELFRRLQEADPESAKLIHPHNKRRVVRALEIYYENKIPFSRLKEKKDSIEGKYDIEIFALNVNRDILYERINKRVDGMFKKGLLAEVKKLSEKKLSKTASLAIGVRELLDFLNKKLSLAEAKTLIKRNSRRYAKRQLTWFRADKRIKWIEVSTTEKPGETAKKIMRMLSE